MKIFLLGIALFISAAAGAEAGDWEHAPKFFDFQAGTILSSKCEPASRSFADVRSPAINGASQADSY